MRHALERSWIAPQENDVCTMIGGRDGERTAQSSARAGDDDTPPG
jgi:hypothetical protein